MTKKEERMLAILRPLYEDRKVFHYKGGNCELLEEELKQIKPAHDDIKNAVADALSIAVAPKYRTYHKPQTIKVMSRFGGI